MNDASNEMTFGAPSLLGAYKLDFVLKQLSTIDEIEGMMIEVGCFQGGTLLAMSAMKPWRRCCGFDTMEGLPEPDENDVAAQGHKKGDFSNIQENMVEEFGMRGIPMVKKEFPIDVPPLPVAFCHLDVDLYKGTLASLEYLKTNLNVGGLIVLDDYKFDPTPGVEKAVQEFLKDAQQFQVAAENQFQISLVKVG